MNHRLKFAVLDFSLSTLPAIAQTLNVYRQGQKVGEVRISGPIIQPHAVADITAGQLEAGDEVRD